MVSPQIPVPAHLSPIEWAPRDRYRPLLLWNSTYGFMVGCNTNGYDEWYMCSPVRQETRIYPTHWRELDEHLDR